MRTDVVSQTLARNRLGVPAVVFFALAAVAPMTVIAGGATAGWQVTGVIGIPVAYLAVGVVLAIFSVGYTAMSRKIVNSGAFYSYITHGLGRIPGGGAAFLALAAYNPMQIGLYGGFGTVTAGLATDWLGWHAAWWVWAFAAWAVIALLGVLRVELNGRVLAVLLLAEIAVAVLYAVVEVTHPAGGRASLEALVPARLFDPGIGAGFATAIAGFVGFEAGPVFSEETKDPRRTVPRATYLALLTAGLLYAFCSWAMSVAAGPQHVVAQARAQSTELMFTLVRPYLAPFWLSLGHLLFATSLFAALLAFHNAVARYSFALGRERVLPAFLGTTGRHNSAPVWGSLSQSILAAAVLVIYAVVGLDPIVWLFFALTVLGGLGVLILMTFTSLAVIAFFARNRPARAEVGVLSRIIAPAIAFAALGWVLYLTLDQFHTLLGLPPDSPWRWLPVLFAVVAAAGMLWAAVLKLRAPHTYHAMGLGAASVLADTARPAIVVGADRYQR